MNEDVLKPFPCKEAGCALSFFTEDHLSVHCQAKHGGKLNLEIPKGSNTIFSKQEFSVTEQISKQTFFLADQTPTPTRLLNNCEELRVFDDLQNINPFEEGFRRAVEDSDNGITRDSFLQTPSSQDTLHTPQILPPYEDRPVKRESKAELPTQDEPENLTISSASLEYSNHIPKHTQDEVIATETYLDVKPVHRLTQPPIPLLPKASIIYAAPILTAQSALQLTQPADGSRTNESVKNKLKNILLSNSGSQIDKKRIKTEPVPTIIIGTVPLVASPANMIITNSSSSLRLATSAPSPEDDAKASETASNGTRKRTRSDKSESSSLKVERNRAAARRYR